MFATQNRMIRIPAYCSKCKEFFPSGIALGVDFQGQAILSGNQQTCPKGHAAHVLDGTFTIKDGLLTVIRRSPEVACSISALANSALRGKTDANSALDEICELAPELVQAIKTRLKSSSAIQVVQLIIAILGCLTAAFQWLSDGTQQSTLVNNTIIVQPNVKMITSADEVHQVHPTKEQVRKSKERQKKKLKKRKRQQRRTR